MAKKIAELLAKIESPGATPIRAVQVRDVSVGGTPIALTLNTPVDVWDINWVDGVLLIDINTDPS